MGSSRIWDFSTETRRNECWVNSQIQIKQNALLGRMAGLYHIDARQLQVARTCVRLESLN